MKNVKQILLVGILMFVAAAHGATDGQSSASSQGQNSTRMAKRFGATVGLLGSPYPSVFGMNVNYNMTDFMRASLGYGEASVLDSKFTTIGGGVTGFLPGWNFSPTAGLHVSNVSSSGSMSLQGFEGSGSVVYASLGFDWQTGGGFNLASGMIMPFGRGTSNIYASLGWFFDAL